MGRIVKTAFIFLLTMTLVACAGKGKGERDDDSYIRIHNDGSITEYIGEDFDEDVYSEKDLLKMIEDEMKAYNGRFQTERISLISSKVSDDEVKIKLAYKSAEDYASFNGVNLKVTMNEADGSNVLTIGFPYDIYIDGKIISYSEGIRMVDEHHLSMDNVDSGYILFK